MKWKRNSLLPYFLLGDIVHLSVLDSNIFQCNELTGLPLAFYQKKGETGDKHYPTQVMSPIQDLHNTQKKKGWGEGRDLKAEEKSLSLSVVNLEYKKLESPLH